MDRLTVITCLEAGPRRVVRRVSILPAPGTRTREIKLLNRLITQNGNSQGSDKKNMDNNDNFNFINFK